MKGKIPFVIRYQNHGIGMLKLNDIINSQAMEETIPLAAIEKFQPMLIYKYEPTIRSKIFNYKETVKNYESNSEDTMTCSCADSEYTDKDHKHVVTGNLHIIKNKKLRDLFRKGPNFRERKPITWWKTMRYLKQDINNFIKKWSNTTGMAEECFSEWKITLLANIKEKIKTLRRRLPFTSVKSVLNDKKCKEDLDELKDKYVLVPIDKAANNIGFICKKYFLQIIKQETLSETYEECEETVEEVISNVKEGLSDTGISFEKDFKDLPQIHATLKMHKTPVKFRFIIGSRTSILKSAAKKLVQILKLVMRSHRRYCNKIKFYTGIERYWIADNNKAILDYISHINTNSKARNVQTFDFSTLYTKIPLEDLKEKLQNVISKAFKGGCNQYIRVSRTEARWNNQRNRQTYSKEQIFKMLDLVIENSFFTFGSTLYRQKIGIPMGIDPAPQMANLYLYYYEAAYMEKLTKENYGAARKFNFTSRFIDDLATLNNDGQLMKEKEKIYPDELKLNLENPDDQHATFLDLNIAIEQTKFNTKTYDKREDFNFDIVNFPDLAGNIPHRAAYGVYISQIIRYARLCSRFEDFINCIQLLKSKLLKKNFNIQRLSSTLKKCLLKYTWIQEKFKKRFQEIYRV